MCGFYRRLTKFQKKVQMALFVRDERTQNRTRNMWSRTVLQKRTQNDFESEHWMKIMYEIHVRVRVRRSQNGLFSCSRHIWVKVDGSRWNKLDGSLDRTEHKRKNS